MTPHADIQRHDAPAANLHRGDRVRVTTGFGEGPIEEHVVLGIFTRESSDELPSIAWASLTDRTYVADLDNGHWAYGFQLRPIEHRPDDGACTCTPCVQAHEQRTVGAADVTAWETAYRLNQSLFFEPATDTIRQCPTNYCLLVRRADQWICAIDPASAVDAQALDLLLDQGWRSEADGSTLADVLAESLYGRRPIPVSR